MNIKHFNDPGYSVVITPDEYHVQYDVYEHEGYYEDGMPVFHMKGANTHPSPSTGIDDAEIYMNGDVKWDGCSNWEINENDRCMLHGCNKDDLLNIGKIMGECWDMTKDYCKSWSV